MITICLCLLLSGAGLQDTPSQRLEQVATRLEILTDLRWNVVREGTESLTTHMIARSEPFRFRVSRSGGSESTVLGDATRVRAYDDSGQITAERPTFPTASRDALSVVSDAQADFAGTWQALLDPTYLKRIAATGQVLDVGRDDIQGEACHVLLLNRAGARIGPYRRCRDPRFPTERAGLDEHERDHLRDLDGRRLGR